MLSRTSEASVQDSAEAPDPVVLVLTALALSAAYAAFAMASPFEPSLRSLLQLTGIVFFGVLVIAARGRRDLFDLLNVFTALFVGMTSIGVLVEVDRGWSYLQDPRSLLDTASFYALGCLLAVLGGYYSLSWALGSRGAHGCQIEERVIDRRSVRFVAFGCLAAGSMCYAVLFVEAGGFDRIIASDTSQVDLTLGLGVYYWGSSLLFSGGALYFAEAASRRRQRQWLHAFPLVLTSLAFVPFQNRSRAAGPLLIAVLLSHYLIRPVRFARWIPIAILVFFVASFVRFARNPEIRPLLFVEPGTVVSTFVNDFWDQLTFSIGGDISRLPIVMLVFDRSPGEIPYALGGTFRASLNPVLRLFGFEQGTALGAQLFHSTFPEARSWQYSGLNPSFIGELRANFPWPIAMASCVAVGLALRTLRDKLLGRRDFVSLAIYAVAVNHIVRYSINTSQEFFDATIMLSPMIFAWWIAVQQPGREGNGLRAWPGPPAVLVRPGVERESNV